MAMPKPFIIIASIFLSFIFILLQVQSISTQEMTGNTTVSKQGYGSTIDCKAACSARCRLSSRPNLCKRACGTCCNRCNCVPPGTSGNLDVCPCYASLTTRGNKRKCP